MGKPKDTAEKNWRQTKAFRGLRQSMLDDLTARGLVDQAYTDKVEEYMDLFVEILRRLRPDIVVERFASEAPPRYHHGRNWGLLRNETLWSMLEKRLREKGAYQGEKFIHL